MKIFADKRGKVDGVARRNNGRCRCFWRQRRIKVTVSSLECNLQVHTASKKLMSCQSNYDQ